MLLCYLLMYGVVGAVVASDESRAACQPAEDGNSYREEVLFGNASYVIGGPAVNWKTNELYFMDYHSYDYSTSHVINLEDKSHRVLGVLPKTCKHTVDQLRGRLYVGCNDFDTPKGGIYVFDYNVKRFVRLDDEDQNVSYVNFNGVLYYTNKADKLYTFVKGRSEPVPELQDTTVWDFVVLNNGDKVIRSTSGIFYVKANSTELVNLHSYTDFLHFAVDPQGNAYGCSSENIYRLNSTTAEFTSKVVETPHCSSLAATQDESFVYVKREQEVIQLVKCFNK